MITGKTAQEITDCIRELIQRGDLNAGSSLPPVRELAGSLGVNRNTVAAAYQRLAQAGIAATQGRLGTIIRSPYLAGEQEGLSNGTALTDLADGNPNPQWLPDAAKLLSERSPGTYLYGDDTILPDLRRFGQEWLQPDCPSDCELELTNGAVDAIERLATAHLVPGDKVAIEDPCFLGTINALRLAGIHTVGMEMDESGLRPEALKAALDKGVRAVLITPRTHNPTGRSLDRIRADEIRHILSAYPDVLVIVDDHFALLAETPYYPVIPATTLHWSLVRSVSKGLGPDLRLAFVSCDTVTATRLRSRLAPGMTWVSHILQSIVLCALTSDDVREDLNVARIMYARYRAEMYAALQNEGIILPPVTSGFNVWVPLSRNEKDVAYEMAKKGWLIRPSSAFDVMGQSRAIRVTVSKLRPGQAQQFAQDLKRCMA